MSRYLLRRLVHSLLVVAGVLILVFFLTRAIGDPVKMMIPPGSPAERYDEMRESLGLDRPLAEQFVRTTTGWLTGDFGDSIWLRVPALPVALERVPATLYLTLAAVLLALPMAALLGIVSALRPGSALDRVVSVGSVVGFSIADFWLGLMLILLFAVTLGWVPTSGFGGAEYLILPALTLALPMTGRVARVLRAAMLDEVNKPYVVVARAHGLTELQIVVRHLFRNASIPAITIAGAEVIALLNGAIVVETIFAWPGIGKQLYDAITHRDAHLVEATVFVIALTVVLVNLAIDFTYSRLDPRVSHS